MQAAKPIVWPNANNLMMPTNNVTADFGGGTGANDMAALFATAGGSSNNLIPKVPGAMEPKNSIQAMLLRKGSSNNNR